MEFSALHDREALLPREQQRRFLQADGWVAWSGPAVAELLRQFVVHNRMMSGGAVIDGTLITLAEIVCPILAFVGEIGGIGQPASVRESSTPPAQSVRDTDRNRSFRPRRRVECRHTPGPQSAIGCLWRDGQGTKPDGVRLMEGASGEGVDDSPGLTSRVGHSARRADGTEHRNRPRVRRGRGRSRTRWQRPRRRGCTVGAPS